MALHGVLFVLCLFVLVCLCVFVCLCAFVNVIVFSICGLSCNVG